MLAEPKLTPKTAGCTAGAVAPAAMNTEAGVIATFDASLLLSETVTPPAGAGTVKFTGNGSVWLGPTATLPVRLIEPEEADRFVSVKTAGVATPAADAVTAYVPATP